MTDARIKQNRNKKFDLQLSQGLIDERGLAEIFGEFKIEKVELKTETYKWEKTRNLFIEYQINGRASGIAATTADMWVQQLRGIDGETFGFFMFPVERLKRLCRAAIRGGRRSERAGDGGLSKGAFVNIDALLATIR